MILPSPTEPEEESNLWDWWHSILIYCVVAVIVLTMLVLTLLMVSPLHCLCAC